MQLPNNWPQLMLPGLKARFQLNLKEHPDVVARLFNIQPSSRLSEKTHGIGNLGLLQPWTGSTHYEDFRAGYTPEYNNDASVAKESLGVTIEKELPMFDQYNEIKARISNLAESAAYTRQYHGALLFCRAFDGGYVMPGGDGKPLCSTAHPTSPDNATTWSNANTNLDLTADNLEAIRTAMMGWTDDKGKLLLVNPDTLLVPPALREAALVIAGSDGKPDIADNNINIWKGKITVIEWQLLTTAYGLPAAKTFFVMDSKRRKRFLRWFDVRKNEFDDYVEFDSEVAKYRVISHASRGWDHPSFVYGCYKA